MSEEMNNARKEINIEEIIQEIREEIREKGYQPSDLSFQDIPVPGAAPAAGEDDLKVELDYLSANYSYDIGLPFYSSNPVTRLIKKLIRKTVKFLFYPMVVFQNEYNASSLRAITVLTRRMEALPETKRKTEELEKKVCELQQELQALREELQKARTDQNR